MSSGVAFPLVSPLGGNPTGTSSSPAVRDAFGVDILFTDKGLETTHAGDYAEVSGLENLRRAIVRRLITRPGEYRVNPHYGVGLPSYIKKPMTTTLLAELTQRIVEQVSQDRRVDRVVEVKLTPTLFGGSISGLRVGVVVQALGRTVNFSPFDFKQGV